MRSDTSNLPYLELHVPDFALVREFYLPLGFQVLREEHNEPQANYLVLGLEKNILAFWGGNESVSQHSYFGQFDAGAPRGVGVEIVLFVSQLETILERVSAKSAVMSPIQHRPWGVRDFRMKDPFGFYLRFSEPHSVEELEGKERI